MARPPKPKPKHKIVRTRPVRLGDEIRGRVPVIRREPTKLKAHAEKPRSASTRSGSKSAFPWRLYSLITQPAEIERAISVLINYGVAPSKLYRLIQQRKAKRRPVGRPIRWTKESRFNILAAVLKVRGEQTPKPTEKNVLRMFLEMIKGQRPASKITLKALQNQMTIARKEVQKSTKN